MDECPDCEDDTTWYYKKAKKTCETWVAEDPEKRCRDDKYYGATKDADEVSPFEACKATCENCDADSGDCDCDCSDEEEVIEELQHEVEDLEDENEKLQDEVYELVDYAQDLVDEVDELESHVEELERTLDEVVEAYDAYIAQLEEQVNYIAFAGCGSYDYSYYGSYEDYYSHDYDFYYDHVDEWNDYYSHDYEEYDDDDMEDEWEYYPECDKCDWETFDCSLGDEESGFGASDEGAYLCGDCDEDGECFCECIEGEYEEDDEEMLDGFCYEYDCYEACMQLDGDGEFKKCSEKDEDTCWEKGYFYCGMEYEEWDDEEWEEEEWDDEEWKEWDDEEWEK